jgi:hypothetical protein
MLLFLVFYFRSTRAIDESDEELPSNLLIKASRLSVAGTILIFVQVAR